MRIVLVDPSRTVQKIVERLLLAQGHDVRSFSNEWGALEHVRRDTAVDAVICSGELESMSGLGMCSEIREIAGDKRFIYVLLMSSNFGAQQLIDALDSGADDFVRKPPVPEELYARLRAAERVIGMQRELMRLATTDPLTGLLNRRAFFEQAQECCSSRLANVSSIMLDIDHFKSINDTYGHAAGDDTIRRVADVVTTHSKFAGRLGGEELAILLEDTSLAAAVEVAELIRSRIQQLRVRAPDGIITLTASLGVSERRPGETIDELLKRADLALYAAKQTGRNRVVAADSATFISTAGARTSRIRGASRLRETRSHVNTSECQMAR